MYIAASVGRDLYPIHSSILFLRARLLTALYVTLYMCVCDLCIYLYLRNTGDKKLYHNLRTELQIHYYAACRTKTHPPPTCVQLHVH